MESFRFFEDRIIFFRFTAKEPREMFLARQNL